MLCRNGDNDVTRSWWPRSLERGLAADERGCACVVYVDDIVCSVGFGVTMLGHVSRLLTRHGDIVCVRTQCCGNQGFL